MDSPIMNTSFNERFEMYKKIMEGRDEIDQFLILQEKKYSHLRNPMYPVPRCTDTRLLFALPNRKHPTPNNVRACIRLGLGMYLSWECWPIVAQLIAAGDPLIERLRRINHPFVTEWGKNVIDRIALAQQRCRSASSERDAYSTFGRRRFEQRESSNKKRFLKKVKAKVSKCQKRSATCTPPSVPQNKVESGSLPADYISISDDDSENQQFTNKTSPERLNISPLEKFKSSEQREPVRSTRPALSPISSAASNGSRSESGTPPPRGGDPYRSIDKGLALSLPPGPKEQYTSLRSAPPLKSTLLTVLDIDAPSALTSPSREESSFADAKQPSNKSPRPSTSKQYEEPKDAVERPSSSAEVQSADYVIEQAVERLRTMENAQKMRALQRLRKLKRLSEMTSESDRERESDTERSIALQREDDDASERSSDILEALEEGRIKLLDLVDENWDEEVVSSSVILNKEPEQLSAEKFFFPAVRQETSMICKKLVERRLLVIIKMKRRPQKASTTISISCPRTIKLSCSLSVQKTSCEADLKRREENKSAEIISVDRSKIASEDFFFNDINVEVNAFRAPRADSALHCLADSPLSKYSLSLLKTDFNFLAPEVIYCIASNCFMHDNDARRLSIVTLNENLTLEKVQHAVASLSRYASNRLTGVTAKFHANNIFCIVEVQFPEQIYEVVKEVLEPLTVKEVPQMLVELLNPTPKHQGREAEIQSKGLLSETEEENSPMTITKWNKGPSTSGLGNEVTVFKKFINPSINIECTADFTVFVGHLFKASKRFTAVPINVFRLSRPSQRESAEISIHSKFFRLLLNCEAAKTTEVTRKTKFRRQPENAFVEKSLPHSPKIKMVYSIDIESSDSEYEEESIEYTAITAEFVNTIFPSELATYNLLCDFRGKYNRAEPPKKTPGRKRRAEEDGPSEVVDTAFEWTPPVKKHSVDESPKKVKLPDIDLGTMTPLMLIRKQQAGISGTSPMPFARFIRPPPRLFSGRQEGSTSRASSLVGSPTPSVSSRAQTPAVSSRAPTPAVSRHLTVMTDRPSTSGYLEVPSVVSPLTPLSSKADSSRPPSSLFDELRSSISGLQKGPGTSENTELSISTSRQSALSLLAEVSFRHESLSALSSKEATPSPAPSSACATPEPRERKEGPTSESVTEKQEKIEQGLGRRGKRPINRSAPDTAEEILEQDEPVPKRRLRQGRSALQTDFEHRKEMQDDAAQKKFPQRSKRKPRQNRK